ncbi:MAG: hypothetical protein ACP5RS_04185 [Thermoplasmata archaeon]|jgi:hypothetical protein
MPIPEEFIKKREEVVVRKVDLKDIKCIKCGAPISPNNIKNGYAKCEYCGTTFSLDI